MDITRAAAKDSKRLSALKAQMNDQKIDRTCPEVITLTKEVFPDA